MVSAPNTAAVSSGTAIKAASRHRTRQLRGRDHPRVDQRPKVAGRAMGWVRVAPPKYGRRVIRVAVRCCKTNGQVDYGVVVSSLTCGEF